MKDSLDDDGEASVWGKINFSTGKLIWKSEFSAMISFKFKIPVFCFLRSLLEQHTDWAKQRWCWWNTLMFIPNSDEDFLPLHRRELFVCMVKGCRVNGSHYAADFLFHENCRATTAPEAASVADLQMKEYKFDYSIYCTVTRGLDSHIYFEQHPEPVGASGSVAITFPWRQDFLTA